MRNSYGDPLLLFAGSSLSEVVDNQIRLAKKEVEKINPNQLLNASTDTFVSYVFNMHCINALQLHLDRAEVDQREARVGIYDRFDQQEYFRPGQIITLSVPFSGDEALFKVRPNNFNLNPPRAEISNGHMHVSFSGTEPSPAEVKSAFESTTASVNQYIDWQRPTIEKGNDQIREAARNAIEERKARLLHAANTVAALGYPLKARAEAPKTYVAPQVRRKVVPTFPAVSANPYKPEPALEESVYKHILSVIENMAHVLERSPSSFGGMSEEDLRQHFLVQLNGQFEGRATGETFNHQGKTDILLRDGDRNVFIAECKFWTGEKGFLEAVDQILSYLSWRDTKTAIIVFNRQKNFSATVEKIELALQKHSKIKGRTIKESETRYRSVFGQPNDANREVILTVLAFDVPSD